MGKTSIEWTDRTWNPVRGCSRVSEGCRNCYAETMAARFSDPGQPFHLFANRARSGSKWTGRVELVESKLDEPFGYRGNPRVFVNSMSDLFHEQLSDVQIGRVFFTMAQNTQCTFQVLTKRAHRMAEWFIRLRGHFMIQVKDKLLTKSLPFEHIWLGVSVENQDAHDERVPYLQSVSAAVRFLSIEPMLGPITLDLRGIHWVIVGGESGPGARPMHPDWVRSIRGQCAAARVPFFFKQWGDWAMGNAGPGGDLYDIAWTARPERVGMFDHCQRWNAGMPNAFRQTMVRVGKKAAGRLLDGVEYSEFPC